MEINLEAKQYHIVFGRKSNRRTLQSGHCIRKVSFRAKAKHISTQPYYPIVGTDFNLLPGLSGLHCVIWSLAWATLTSIGV